ncbi:hypothetical protein, partial [Sutterella wadsworthensis]
MHAGRPASEKCRQQFSGIFGVDLNYGLPALHFESPRWFRKLEQFKTAPTRGRNTVPDPSVGVVSFM